MKKIISLINKKKKSKIDNIIKKRIKEFESFKNKSNDVLFKELSFCILTANYSAENSIRIQNQINNGFLKLNESQLAKRLREVGYRFPNLRAKYIIKSRIHKNSLKNILKKNDEKEVREWIVKNITGLGYKEASHFLRNIGFKNLAIIDFHIIDILEKNDLIKRPKTITKKKYLEIENVLENIAKKAKTNLAELDLYLWHEETGKVLK